MDGLRAKKTWAVLSHLEDVEFLCMILQPVHTEQEEWHVLRQVTYYVSWGGRRLCVKTQSYRAPSQLLSTSLYRGAWQ